MQRKTFDTLRQTYRFFALYANLEGWTADAEAPAERSVLDRWLLSRLASVTAEVTEDLEGYNLTHAVRAIADFVVDDLSQLVRAPLARPLLGERRRGGHPRRLRHAAPGAGDGGAADGALRPVPQRTGCTARSTGESVHLAAFPAVDRAAVDAGLERGMQAVRTLSTLGRAARDAVGIRVRQPLGTLYAVVPDGYAVDATLLEILRDELNVRAVEFMHRAEELVTFSAKPNFKALGAVFGKRTPKVADAIRALDSAVAGGLPRAASRCRCEADGEPVDARPRSTSTCVQTARRRASPRRTRAASRSRWTPPSRRSCGWRGWRASW